MINKIKQKITEFKQRLKLVSEGLSFSIICLWLFVGLPLLGLYKFLGFFVDFQGVVADLYNKVEDLVIKSKEIYK